MLSDKEKERYETIIKLIKEINSDLKAFNDNFTKNKEIIKFY